MGLFHANLGCIEVFSQRSGAKAPPADYHQVFIDRPSHSLMANPFIAKDKSMAERNRVCDAFEAKLTIKLQNPKDPVRLCMAEICRMAMSGTNIALMCWCAPKRCHGHSIKRKCDERIKRLLRKKSC